MGIPKCTSWHGHRFEARYSTTAPNITKLGEVFDVHATVAIIRALTPKTYHYDICTRCGHIVKAKSDPS